MTPASAARIRARFEQAEEVFPIPYPVSWSAPSQGFSQSSLSQKPQLSQPKASACRAITELEYEFDERAAIIEYDGGLPRGLAEFLARRGKRGGKGHWTRR